MKNDWKRPETFTNETWEPKEGHRERPETLWRKMLKIPYIKEVKKDENNLQNPFRRSTLASKIRW